ncbi:MAG: MCE family protein [Alphaproteobacteria bacterium]|nr:MCE family protein [Alphaproteobacteria bacterium]
MKISSENRSIIAGALLVAVLIVLLGFVHSRAAMDKDKDGFVLYAPFTKADGLMNGADVRIAGIKVGRVLDQMLGEGYQVRVKIGFFEPIKISDDSSAIIETDGLLGSKYLEIIPGGTEDMLSSGDEILYTQDALILSELMDKVNAYMREKKQVKTSDEGDLE